MKEGLDLLTGRDVIYGVCVTRESAKTTMGRYQNSSVLEFQFQFPPRISVAVALGVSGTMYL